MKSVYMVCYLDNITGYGQQNCRIVEGLLQAGVNPTVFPTALVEHPALLSEDILSRVTRLPQTYPEFLIAPPSYKPASKVIDRVWLAIWESTKYDASWIKRIDQSAAVITPSSWGASCLSSCGVESPIYCVPLFVPTPYTYCAPLRKDTYTFGCSGHLSSQAPRKNLPAAIQAFQQAFPKTDDVRLKIKIGEFDHLEVPDDRRIEVTRGYLAPEQMKDWYVSLDVFVHPARAEGWGFQPLQAMALGRAVIACKYSAMAEYFDSQVGLETEYTHELAHEMYHNMGHWANPSIDSLAENMLYAYRNNEEMLMKGVRGSSRALDFTLERTMSKLVPILEKHGIIT